MILNQIYCTKYYHMDVILEYNLMPALIDPKYKLLMFSNAIEIKWEIYLNLHIIRLKMELITKLIQIQCLVVVVPSAKRLSSDDCSWHELNRTQICQANSTSIFHPSSAGHIPDAVLNDAWARVKCTHQLCSLCKRREIYRCKRILGWQHEKNRPPFSRCIAFLIKPSPTNISRVRCAFSAFAPARMRRVNAARGEAFAEIRKSCVKVRAAALSHREQKICWAALHFHLANIKLHFASLMRSPPQPFPRPGSNLLERCGRDRRIFLAYACCKLVSCLCTVA